MRGCSVERRATFNSTNQSSDLEWTGGHHLELEIRFTVELTHNRRGCQTANWDSLLSPALTHVTHGVWGVTLLDDENILVSDPERAILVIAGLWAQ